jgi:hypothetical protein
MSTFLNRSKRPTHLALTNFATLSNIRLKVSNTNLSPQPRSLIYLISLLKYFQYRRGSLKFILDYKCFSILQHSPSFIKKLS